MTKLTVEIADSEVYDFVRICQDVSKYYDWDVPYKVNSDGTVDFTMDNVRYRGEMVGYDFTYSEVEDDGTVGEVDGLLDWIEAISATTVLKATAPGGEEVFIVAN